MNNNAAMHIAPCGMNCALCMAFQRAKKNCPGCGGPDENKPTHCTVCRIKQCRALGSSGAAFCYACAKFPCIRLKRLDARYRTRYGMSMLENLEAIRRYGLEKFSRMEINKWTCPGCGALLCVHREMCPECGGKNPHFPGGGA